VNYDKIYRSIIYDPRNNLLNKEEDGYEVHHILPRSLGGTESFENKIKLTYRQHFICHWLLWKMFSGSDCEKMRNAFWLMANANSKRYNRTSSKVYSKLKIEFSKSRSERMRGNTFNVGRKHSIENNLANGERTRKIHQNRPRDEQLVINQKISRAITGIKRTPEQNEANRQRNLGNVYARGTKRSEKFKKEKALLMTGNQYAKGYRQTPEQRKANSERQKGKPNIGNKIRWAKWRQDKQLPPRPDDEKYLTMDTYVR